MALIPPVPRPPANDDADPLDDALLGDLLDPMVEDDGDDADADVEDESEVDEPPELAAEDDAELDTGGELDEVEMPPEQGWSDDGATLGPNDGEPLDDLESLTPLEPDDLADGPDEPLPDLALPELDAASDDDAPADAGAELPASLALGDEPWPEPAERPWSELEPGIALEACAALAVSQGSALAASTDLLWFARGELSPLRLEAGATRLHSVALTGGNADTALASTTSGRLYRRGRSASVPEELRAIRVGSETSAREPLDLRQPDAAFDGAVLARSASGRLFQSGDGGVTFHSLAAPLLVALVAEGGPAIGVTHDGKLLVASGRELVERPLSGLNREIARSRAPLVAAEGELVVLGSESTGVLVSTDGGREFRRVAGTRGVTAVSVIRRSGGAPRVVAALESSGLDVSLVVEIDATSATAHTLARITGDSDAEAGDRVRVYRLAWDAVHSRLWAAGAFGLKVYAPPALAA
jgi:hypothetical protein